MWLGQAPWEPYSSLRCHYNFRFIRDYSGGQVTNWGAHHLDITQWALGMDDSGPIEVTGHGQYPEEGLYNTAAGVHFECLYENGVKVTCATGGSGGEDADTGINSGITFIGTEGKIFVNRGRIRTEPEPLLKQKTRPEEVNLYKSREHHRNFIDCVKTRQAPICEVGIGHRSATVCHLGNIAMLLGRKLRWDPKAERFIGDDDAQRLVSRAMRAPWRLV
jgi:predicted dehydrogenase